MISFLVVWWWMMFNSIPNTINGFKIMENPLMTEAGEPYEVKRSWKERLFTRPWRPFKKTRTVVPQIPSRQIIMMDRIIYMHPILKAEVEALKINSV